MGKCMWRSFGEGGGFSEVGEGRGFGGVSCLKTPQLFQLVEGYKTL